MQPYGVVCSLLLFVGLIFGLGCRDSTRPPVEHSGIATPNEKHAAGENPQIADNSAEIVLASNESFIAEHRPSIDRFCGDCHATPRPASSGKEDWLGEIEQGLSLYEFSGRSDLQVPDKNVILKFFQIQAPDKLRVPDSTLGYAKTSLPLSPSRITNTSGRAPGITNVRWIDVGLNDAPTMVYCDINTGAVMAHWFDNQNARADGAGETKKLATLLQPVHTEPCDLDQDGLVDLLVADIGEFSANDSDLGRVIWLRRESAESDGFETIVLSEGLSRVADVQSGDFDGDDDIDVLVGEFGWRTTGKIFMLVNSGLDEKGRPKFETRVIDKRNGPVNVPPVDLDSDGDLDFIALISQEHEVVEAFINDGKGNFTNHLLWRAPDPAYGSSGLNLVDMDLDGDLDVLYTNGDSFDRGFKPHHSIQWLENEGSYPFVHHTIANMPGVLNAKAADFDGDGDMDVVACSLLAGGAVKEFASAGVASLVMLTQTEPGKFEPTAIENGLYNHISLDVEDMDKNDRPDIAVGNFRRQGSPDEPAVEVWFNGE
jgi:FG-GAP-like repeat